MDHFHYRGGVLSAEDVPLTAIADAAGTPVYVYSTATLTRHYRVFARAVDRLDAMVCFAVKANANLAVIRTLADLGAGADVVSGGELQIALAARVPPERIVFSGVGKTKADMAAALRAGVKQINVESGPELDALNAVAQDLGVRAPVAIRVNPDIDAKSHHKISTGRTEDKFGVEWTAAHQFYTRAAALSGISLIGVAVHIGSQLTDLAPFRDAFHRVRDLVAILRADGHAIETLDVGGGLGIPYGNEPAPPPNPGEYAEMVGAILGDLGCRLIFEPGRLLVGNAGVLLTRVVYVKEGPTRTFVIVDAGMNDLLRPSLYGAHHAIVPVAQATDDAQTTAVDVAGPICETGDTFATGRALPPVKSGNLLAFRTAGAYCAVMASTYNARPLVPEVMVNGGEFAIIRPALTIEELLRRQRLPPWLAADDGTAPGTPRLVGGER